MFSYHQGAFFLAAQPVLQLKLLQQKVVATAVESQPASEVAATAEEKPAVESGATTLRLHKRKKQVSNEAANTEGN